MKKSILIVFIGGLCSLAFICNGQEKQQKNTPSVTPSKAIKWKLVFEENFDGTAVDTTVWRPYYGGGHVGNGLRRPEAFSVENGLLVVTAQMKNGKLVSGAMAHRKNYTYGKIEFRVRTEKDPTLATSGVVLTWPESGKWPIDGELDIYETMTNAQRNPFYTVLHYGADNKQIQFDHKIDATQWHTVRIEWLPDIIHVYRDNELVFTSTDKEAIPQVPHHVCIQLDAFKTEMTGQVKMYVDWVKIYQPEDDPYIGAQVIIEPGQSPEQIESWFRLLNENGMNVCRIRMFEEYMKKADGSWDYSLFDHAFRAAEKYHVKVFATLFPSSKGNSVGGFKFPESEEHLKQIADYIAHTVAHFKSFKSMYAWVLVNEPGTGGVIPQTPFSKQQFERWKENQKKSEYTSKDYTLLVNFDDKKFLLDYNTWYLKWIAGEIKKYDTGSAIHVNNHAIFGNVAEYDFPAWRTFLTSLGGSAHPSWHFSYFNRSQYAMALAANCEIIRSGAGEIPFWITELQGGNNTYSGMNGFCPTADEIAQWLWTCIGANTQGIIFWSLNSRSIGEESGEWALLDFQNSPSERLLAAKNVTRIIDSNKELFNQAQPIESPISILYIRESLWTEKQVQYGNKNEKDYEGRLPGGVMKSAVAFFEILAENGIKSNLKEINEFDWTKNDYTGECIILANQVAIPSRYWELLEHFVRNGGKLIVEGLTAYYDENMLSLNSTDFPLQALFGGALSEVICIPGDTGIPFGNTQIPVHLWKSYIHNVTGKLLSTENGHATSIRNQYGKGTVVWLPSLTGLGAERTKNKTPLSNFLRQELKEQVKQLPFIFTSHQNGVLMQTLQTGNTYVTVIINKDDQAKNIELTNHFFTPAILFSGQKAKVSKKMINITPEEIIVIHWK